MESSILSYNSKVTKGVEWRKPQGVSIRILRILLVLGVSLLLYQTAPPPSFHKQLAHAEQNPSSELTHQSPQRKETEVSKKKQRSKPKAKINYANATPQQAKDIAKQMAAARGWKGQQYQALLVLWHNESGWNMHAYNASSGACGIVQSLPCGKIPNPKDVRSQIAWGLDYIKRVYGSPANALSAWQSRSPHWY